jgi:hypothetical protein
MCSTKTKKKKENFLVKIETGHCSSELHTPLYDMIMSKMSREIRAFVNCNRVSTGVFLKNGTFLQVYPTKQPWSNHNTWRQVVVLQNKGKTVEFKQGTRKVVMEEAQVNQCLMEQAENWMRLFPMREKIMELLPADFHQKISLYMRNGDIRALK